MAGFGERPNYKARSAYTGKFSPALGDSSIPSHASPMGSICESSSSGNGGLLAGAVFGKSEVTDKKDTEWITLLTLFQANAADVLGERASAVRGYKSILKRRDFNGSHARARLCLKKPCRKAETIAYLTALSQGK